jgi:hypothetical protein
LKSGLESKVLVTGRTVDIYERDSEGIFDLTEFEFDFPIEHGRTCRMKVKPDSAHRIVLTREIRNALKVEAGQPLEVPGTPGAVLLTPLPSGNGKLVRKRKLKVYTGKIPNVDVEESVSKARHYTRR